MICPFTPGGLWDADKLKVWGQWAVGDQISGLFPLKYAGTQSQFEGRTSAPSGPAKAGLQVMAVDQAGNAGLYTRFFNVGP